MSDRAAIAEMADAVWAKTVEMCGDTTIDNETILEEVFDLVRHDYPDASRSDWEAAYKLLQHKAWKIAREKQLLPTFGTAEEPLDEEDLPDHVLDEIRIWLAAKPGTLQ